jgi:CheY-like chemotaxis protein
MKILFLDDMKSRRDAFQQQSIGHNVDFATNADECVQLLKSNKYDLIYLDHDLEAEHYHQGRDTSPDKDGRFVAQALMGMENHHGTNVIVHSLNPIGRQNIYSILSPKFPVHLGPEKFRHPTIWTVDVNIILRVLNIMKDETDE